MIWFIIITIIAAIREAVIWAWLMLIRFSTFGFVDAQRFGRRLRRFAPYKNDIDLLTPVQFLHLIVVSARPQPPVLVTPTLLAFAICLLR
jgi:hypothetical protein